MNKPKTMQALKCSKVKMGNTDFVVSGSLVFTVVKYNDLREKEKSANDNEQIMKELDMWKVPDPCTCNMKILNI